MYEIGSFAGYAVRVEGYDGGAYPKGTVKVGCNVYTNKQVNAFVKAFETGEEWYNSTHGKGLRKNGAFYDVYSARKADLNNDSQADMLARKTSVKAFIALLKSVDGIIKVAKPTSAEVVIGDYTATLTRKGVEVSGKTISYKALDKLVEATQAFRN